ncbi:MAG: cell division protein SepF [Limnochordia bacterium]|nr:cell division protein SepF [Limnochordia bacterium]
MSGFVHKLKVFLGVSEDYEDEENFERVPEVAEDDVVPLRRDRYKRQTEETVKNKPALVGLAGGHSGPNKMFIMEPRNYEDVKEYVTHLRARRSLILRLHLVDKREAQRIVDFMSGTTYALEGNMRKLGETIFCFTPSSVAIEGDLESDFFEMIKNEGE